MAVVTYNLLNLILDENGKEREGTKWNSTQVNKILNGEWKVVPVNRSFYTTSKRVSRHDVINFGGTSKYQETAFFLFPIISPCRLYQTSSYARFPADFVRK